MTAKSKIEICRAKQEDIPYIEEKLEKYVLDATDIKWEQFFVMKNDRQTVGFGRIKDHGEYFELASLGIDYYHRKKGLGTKMVLFLIEEAKKMNSQKPIYGVTHKSEFFRRLGFKEIGTYPDYLRYKKNYICKQPSQIKIMKFSPLLEISKNPEIS